MRERERLLHPKYVWPEPGTHRYDPIIVAKIIDRNARMLAEIARALDALEWNAAIMKAQWRKEWAKSLAISLASIQRVYRQCRDGEGSIKEPMVRAALNKIRLFEPKGKEGRRALLLGVLDQAMSRAPDRASSNSAARRSKASDEALKRFESLKSSGVPTARILPKLAAELGIKQPALQQRLKRARKRRQQK